MVKTGFKQIAISFSFGRSTIQHRKVAKACGLSSSYIPSSRRTFDRRLKTVYDDIKERITNMGNLFVSQDIVKPYILVVAVPY
jgi:preprotein translocase subunit SecY